MKLKLNSAKAEAQASSLGLAELGNMSLRNQTIFNYYSGARNQHSGFYCANLTGMVTDPSQGDNVLRERRLLQAEKKVQLQTMSASSKSCSSPSTVEEF